MHELQSALTDNQNPSAYLYGYWTRHDRTHEMNQRQYCRLPIAGKNMQRLAIDQTHRLVLIFSHQTLLIPR